MLHHTSFLQSFPLHKHFIKPLPLKKQKKCIRSAGTMKPPQLFKIQALMDEKTTRFHITNRRTFRFIMQKRIFSLLEWWKIGRCCVNKLFSGKIPFHPQETKTKTKNFFNYKTQMPFKSLLSNWSWSGAEQQCFLCRKMSSFSSFNISFLVYMPNIVKNEMYEKLFSHSHNNKLRHL